MAQKGKSKEERDKEKYESDRNEIIEAVGFSKIIRHISNSVNITLYLRF